MEDDPTATGAGVRIAMDDPPPEQGGERPKHAKTVQAKVRDNLEQLAARASARASVARSEAKVGGASTNARLSARPSGLNLQSTLRSAYYCEKELGRDWKAHRGFGEIIGLSKQDGHAKNVDKVAWREMDSKTYKRVYALRVHTRGPIDKSQHSTKFYKNKEHQCASTPTG